MKRRIKFRGKCADTWRKGDHLAYDKCEVIKNWAGAMSFEYTVEPESVGQFTGIYDCEGTEIYEGDICEVSGIRAVVMWDEKYLKFKFLDSNAKKATVNFKKNIGKKSKVVGNIFDNPEFLEGAKIK